MRLTKNQLKATIEALVSHLEGGRPRSEMDDDDLPEDENTTPDTAYHGAYMVLCDELQLREKRRCYIGGRRRS
jgi:hypothetical protein